MSNEVVWSIIIAVITGLCVVVGWFSSKAVAKIDIMSTDVSKILIMSSMNEERTKSHEERIEYLNIKIQDNADKWTELYKDYNLNEIRNK